MKRAPLVLGLCVAGLAACLGPGVTAREADRAAVVGAEVTPGRADEVKARIESLMERPRDLVAQARKREDELRAFPAWQRLAALIETINTIDGLVAENDLARAYEEAYAWQFERMQDGVARGLLEAIPFLVLGPFGEPGFTDMTGEEHLLREDFAGMTNAYLDEVHINKDGSPNPGYLPKDFGPDLDHTYTVYPGTEAKWVPALKTEYLDMTPWCAESPLWMFVYLYTEVYSPETREAAFRIGADYTVGTWIYMNRRMFTGVRPPAGRFSQAAPDQRRCNMRLSKGWNKVLVKTIARQGSRLYLRVTHGWRPGDKRPMHDLRYRLPEDAGQAGE